MQRAGLALLLALGNRFARTTWVRRLLYAIRNRFTFADLYQHDWMLADRVRVDAYREGLSKHIEDGDLVVDLGTGSGILAFLAARRGARQVHAIEHGEVIELARAVARANGVTNVAFHRTHSTSFELAEKADVLVHEQIGDAVFDERVVDNIADLRARVLKPDGLILPSRLQMFVEPVQLIDGLEVPFIWEQEIEGISFRALEAVAPEQPHGYRYRVFRPFPFHSFICEPQAVLEVDLATAVPADLPPRISYERQAVADGRLDGLCVYFRAEFDEQTSFTNSPAERPTSWGTPLLRVAPRRIEPGAWVHVTLEAADLAEPASWSWRVD